MSWLGNQIVKVNYRARDHWDVSLCWGIDLILVNWSLMLLRLIKDSKDSQLYLFFKRGFALFRSSFILWSHIHCQILSCIYTRGSLVYFGMFEHHTFIFSHWQVLTRRCQYTVGSNRLVLFKYDRHCHLLIDWVCLVIYLLEFNARLKHSIPWEEIIGGVEWHKLR